MFLMVCTLSICSTTRDSHESGKMEKPDMNRMWETFIKIGLRKETSFGRIINMIRFNIYPMIEDLKQKKIINWYHFLIHNRESGVPTTEDDNNLYFHIRFTLNKNIEVKEEKDVNGFLPNYCVLTRKRKPRRIERISGIDKSLLRNEKIEEAWRIIGEQSEWLLNMLDIHKEDVEIDKYPKQIAQFLHYFFNMLGGFAILVKCPNCGHVFPFSL